MYLLQKYRLCGLNLYLTKVVSQIRHLVLVKIPLPPVNHPAQADIVGIQALRVAYQSVHMDIIGIQPQIVVSQLSHSVA
jgi:hypothetical protein